MANQIKKGFFFYFGLFVLVLLAIFMVCVVIMMFNPGSSVLWMQYFSNNQTILVQETTDNETAISFAEISSIEVNCGYADVTVAYDDNNSTYSESGIYIVNNAKGFVASSAATQFTYSVVFDSDGILVVTVSEPNGFLYFSSDVKIVIHSSSNDETPVNLGAISFTINTDGGDVSIGGSENVASDVDLLKVNSLRVSSGSGDITFTKNFDTSSLSSLNLTTSSGKITSSARHTSFLDGETSVIGINTNCDVSLTTSSGRIDLNEINSTESISITNTSGDVVLGNVKAQNLNFYECTAGNYALDAFYGLSSSSEVQFGSANSVSKPYLDFGIIDGNFEFFGDTSSSSPTVFIDEVTGNLTMYCLGGSITAGALYGDVEITAGGALKVNIVIATEEDATNSSKVNIKNTSGAIRIGFSDDTSNTTVTVTSTSGNITLDFTTAARFGVDSYSDENETRMDNSKITLNIGDATSSKNPFYFETNSGDSGTFTLITGGNVYFNLVSNV